MWSSGYRANAACNPDERTNCYSDTGNADTRNAYCDAGAAANIDANTVTHCNASVATDADATRLDAAYS